MADEVVDAAKAANGEGASTAASAETEATKAQVMVGMTPEQFKARLEEEREKSRSRVVKELGFEKTEDAKNAFKAFKELQDAQLTEQQKIAKALDELKPQAARAAALESQLSAIVDEQFAAMPEAMQKAIDAVANGNAEERLKLMRVMRAAGVGVAATGAASTDAAVAARPATTAPAAKAPAATKPTTKFDEWQRLIHGGNQVAADVFHQIHGHLIERERPST